MAKSEDLKVKISLQDKLTSGLGKIGGNLEQMNQRTLAFQEKLRGNFDDMVAGVGTAIGAGASLYAAIMPNVELERSLNALEALGVDGELGAIRDSAQQFTKEFGGTSAEFVNHAMAMKQAIGDINESELAKITTATAKLATATGSDVEVVSKYLGRLYHAYRDEADKIGKVDFLSNLTNMTAIAAKAAGKSADEIAGSMESISSLAKNYEISLPEQLAVVGTLQSEFSESDAASYYEAFIREGSKLKELGINTLDNSGQMRPMMDILDQVKAKFGDVNGKGFEVLDQTAGDAAMVISTLLRNTDKFTNTLNNMNLSNGTQAIDDMAAHHTDVLKQLQGSWTAFSENIGQAVMPVVTVVASALITCIDWISDFTQEFPHLTTAVIGSVLAIAAITTAISLGSAAIAMMRTGMTAMMPIMTLTKSLLSGLTFNTQGYSIATMLAGVRTKSLAAIQWLANAPAKGLLFTFGSLAGMTDWLSTKYNLLTASIRTMSLASIKQAAMTKALTIGQAGLNLVMSLNPIGLLVAGLAAGGLMVMRYWQPIKAFFGGFVEGLRASGLFDAFAPLTAVFSWIWGLVTSVWHAMTGWLTPIKYANDELAGFAATGMMVGSMIGDFFGAIGDKLMAMFNGVIKLLNHIPGIDIELPKIDALVRDDSTITTEHISPAVSDANKIQNVQPNVNNNTNNEYHTTAITESIAPAVPVLNQSVDNLQQITPLKQNSNAQPSQGILAEQRKYSMQQTASNSLTTGDIHIHRALADFSLLGLDEQRILTVG